MHLYILHFIDPELEMTIGCGIIHKNTECVQHS
jgi:hypothetical protein